MAHWSDAYQVAEFRLVELEEVVRSKLLQVCHNSAGALYDVLEELLIGRVEGGFLLAVELCLRRWSLGLGDAAGVVQSLVLWVIEPDLLSALTSPISI